MTLHVKLVATLEQIRAEIEAQLAAGGPGMCFYGATSCWWTHDPAELGRSAPATDARIRRTAETLRLNSARPTAPISEFMERARAALSHPLPCDSRGGVLYQTREGDALRFLESALEKPARYGRHGLQAFLASHHRNSFADEACTRPWCGASWDEYNDALDRAIAAGRWNGGGTV